MRTCLNEYLRSLSGFRCLGSVDDSTIESAEQKLGATFSTEYIKYIKTFGIVSFQGHELTGICKSKGMNVVDVTLFARDLYENVEELYVVEDTHIEGEMIWQNADGVIFRSFPNGKPEKVADSLLLYLKQLNNN